MKFQIKARWSTAVKFECELDAKFETESYGLQLGAAFKLAVAAKVNLNECNLDKLDLKNEQFRDLYIYGSTFVGSRFDGSTFVGSRFDGSRFDGSRFDGSRFDGSTFVGSRFDGSRFDGSTFDGSTFDGSTFVGSRFDGSRFDGNNLWRHGAKDYVLLGQRPFFTIGPIGSRAAPCLAVSTAEGVFIQTGCFTGTLEEFRKKVQQEHGDNVHGKEYAAMITLVECHHALWSVDVKG